MTPNGAPLLKTGNRVADVLEMLDLHRGAGSPVSGPGRRRKGVWSTVVLIGVLFLAGCATNSDGTGSETAALATEDGSESGDGTAPTADADDPVEDADHRAATDGDAATAPSPPHNDGIEVMPEAVPMADENERGCSAAEVPEGVNVSWWGLPSEAELSVVGNGVALAMTADRTDGVLTLFGAETELGDLIELEFTSGAGSGSVACELVDDNPDLTDLSSCPADDSAAPGCDTNATPSGDQADELLDARDHFRSTAFGPHAYVVVDIDGTEEDLYLQADGQGGRTFVPPRADTEFLNPFTIHDELLAAIGEGSSVTYQLDQGSGLPVWWTVDHVRTKLVCFELDTAPPELRVGPCDPATDLIDR